MLPQLLSLVLALYGPAPQNLQAPAPAPRNEFEAKPDLNLEQVKVICRYMDELRVEEMKKVKADVERYQAEVQQRQAATSAELDRQALLTKVFYVSMTVAVVVLLLFLGHHLRIRAELRAKVEAEKKSSEYFHERLQEANKSWQALWQRYWVLKNGTSRTSLN